MAAIRLAFFDKQKKAKMPKASKQRGAGYAHAPP
jgi:hypothetical protein